ncbi:MAG: phage antirepressor [Fretibacterium sp.]|nr:phage antirepressor [Fretibacterium sp.]
MNNTIQAFYFERREVRVIEKDGEPWFVAKDVCEILELSDVSMAVRNLDDDEKGTNKVCTPGGEQNMIIISESGLYTLIMRSNKPEARAFRKWVTGTVLPAIRKYGAYRLNGMESLSNPALPASDDSLMLVRDYAKILKANGIDMGERKLFDWFRENGYLIGTPDSRENIVSEKSRTMGLFQTRQWIVVCDNGYSKVKSTPKLTLAGQAFFLNQFRTSAPALTSRENDNPAPLPAIAENPASPRPRMSKPAERVLKWLLSVMDKQRRCKVDVRTALKQIEYTEVGFDNALRNLVNCGVVRTDHHEGAPVWHGVMDVTIAEGY